MINVKIINRFVGNVAINRHDFRSSVVVLDPLNTERSAGRPNNYFVKPTLCVWKTNKKIKQKKNRTASFAMCVIYPSAEHNIRHVVRENRVKKKKRA